MKGKTVLLEELEITILLRLPVKSLFRLKKVCKSWNSLIESPSFIDNYSHISNSRNTHKLICIRKDPVTQNHVVSLFDNQSAKEVANLEWPPFINEGVGDWPSPDDGIEWPPNIERKFHRGISILGPINGIYCIFNRIIERWLGSVTLWNPATREYKHILPFVSFPFTHHLISGFWNYNEDYKMRTPIGLNIAFGIDHNTNDFKVVVISHFGRVYGDDDDRWHVKVHDFSTNCWRTLYYLHFYNDVLSPFQGLVPPFPSIQSEPQFAHCFLKGAFHWSCSWTCNMLGHCEGIVAFHMATDSFQLIKVPPLPIYHYNCRSTWVLRNTLAMVVSSSYGNNGSSGIVEVWMMMEYGVEDSWALVYTFGPINGLRLIGIPNNERIFFRDNKEQLISSTFGDDEVKEHGVFGVYEVIAPIFVHESLQVLMYTESLVSLKLIDQEEEK